METITIPVEGMTCGGCTASVQRAMARLPGVADARAELDPGRVTVTFDPAAVRPEALVEGIEDAGYGVPKDWQQSP